jgi:hypothetical protein
MINKTWHGNFESDIAFVIHGVCRFFYSLFNRLRLETFQRGWRIHENQPYNLSLKMTGIPDEILSEFRKAKSLISVEREEIDDQSIQGFVVNFDSHWIALQYIRDFCHDGLIFLRRADLTSIESRATDRFQRSMIEADGLLDLIDFLFRLPSGGLFLRRSGLV